MAVETSGSEKQGLHSFYPDGSNLKYIRPNQWSDVQNENGKIPHIFSVKRMIKINLSLKLLFHLFEKKRERNLIYKSDFFKKKNCDS